MGLSLAAHEILPPGRDRLYQRGSLTQRAAGMHWHISGGRAGCCLTATATHAPLDHAQRVHAASAVHLPQHMRHSPSHCSEAVQQEMRC